MSKGLKQHASYLISTSCLKSRHLRLRLKPVCTVPTLCPHEMRGYCGVRTRWRTTFFLLFLQSMCCFYSVCSHHYMGCLVNPRTNPSDHVSLFTWKYPGYLAISKLTQLFSWLATPPHLTSPHLTPLLRPHSTCFSYISIAVINTMTML